MTTSVAFLGLGVMGAPMAAHLARAGYPVTVYNRTASKAEDWVARHGGRHAPTPAEAVAEAAVVFTCVGADKDVRAVAQGEQGLLAGLAADAVWIDHTTASATLARELAAATAAVGGHFIDAPVSGGQQGAENGQLTVMAGGDAAVFARIEPLLGAYAKSARRLGPVGSGQLSKMVNQICVAGLVQGLAEGLHFARAAGLDPAEVIDVIRHGAAQSWQMEQRHQSMLAGDYDHGFAVDWMRKDLAIVLDEARQLQASLPVTALVDQLYAEVQQMGGGRWDTSSLLARLERLPGRD